MISLDGLTRKYDTFTAVDDVSFTISSGEVVGLLGHNGAGKTTIMKMMTGYLEPTAGSISINGLDMKKNRRKIQRMLGYLPENCPVYPEMTVIDYLDYAAVLHGVSCKNRTQQIIDALGKTGLREKALQPIATLSRGYRQRTGVAQAILHQPDIIILDEPTNGLDPTQIQQMRSLIRYLAKNATVILSTHILQEVQAVCDRVIILKDGSKALDSQLDALQAENTLLVTIEEKQEQATALFQQINGVEEVRAVVKPDNLDAGDTYALTLESTEQRHQLAASVAAAVQQKGWPLYSMRFESRNLETVFAEITGR
ncbi:MAG: multidrug ABC transporter ATP-binding protein [Desulfobulbus propionicus]|nr:MAG: multidrug ABC transporter ATP-binding protein [Desulfobulbus propionicus]